jgi:putative ABC transport system substrate-binding protein
MPVAIGRRELIAALGSAVAWPLAARAQSSTDRMRRIGVLMSVAESNQQGPAWVARFVQRLQQLGWIDGRNVRIDYRWGGGEPDRARVLAEELVSLAPDAILAQTASVLTALQQQTRVVPIVFVQVSDPAVAGFVASLAHPGGNITGFTLFEFSMAGKWLELLKEIAPHLKRLAIIVGPENPLSPRYVQVLEASNPAREMLLIATTVRDTDEIERAIRAFAHEPNGGLLVLPSITAQNHRAQIIELAALYRLPAVYPYSFFAASGGLMSYGVDISEQFQQAAVYFDRILKGEKPADMPVQQPTKFSLVINLKTAKTLGLTVPLILQMTANEVIE